MFSLDKHTRILQFVGAALAVPAGIAGIYAVYDNHKTGGISCNDLRASIVSELERNLPSDPQHLLLKEQVARFDRVCGEKDPDARVVFNAAVAPPLQEATLQPPPRPQSQLTAPPRPDPQPKVEEAVVASPLPPQPAPQAQSQPKPKVLDAAISPAQPAQPSAPTRARTPTPAPTPVPTLAAANGVPFAIFGLSRTGEKRGWVSLARRNAADNEVHFEGAPISTTSLPAVGAILTAHRLMPVWLQPPPAGKNDPSLVQGRLAAGACVKILSTKVDGPRVWGEVAPVNCR